MKDARIIAAIPTKAETCVVKNNGIFEKFSHEKILKSTRNEKLLQLTNSLMEQVQRFRLMYLNKAIKSTFLIKEHYKIVEAISGRNSEKAESMARIHIQNAEKDMMRMLGSSSGGNDNP